MGLPTGVWVACALFSINHNMHVAWASPEEVSLFHDLFQNYSTSALPSAKHNESVPVSLDVGLRQILDVDERNQFVTSNLAFRVRWIDVHLKWEPDKYNGLKSITIPISDIWVPDITLYNNAGEDYSIMSDTRAKVDNQGNVFWLTPAILKSSCNVDVTYFPFDEQHCDLQFGSWVYDGLQLNLTNFSPYGDTSNFMDNGEWRLIGMITQRRVTYYTCCPQPYPDVTSTIIIRRRPLYYTYNLIFPVVLITALTMLGFHLPPESGEKVSLGVTVLLAMAVFLLLISESMPPTSEVVPLIGQLFGATILLLSLSTAMTVFVLNLHFRGKQNTPVPNWLRRFILATSKVVCMHSQMLALPSEREMRKRGLTPLNSIHDDVLLGNMLEKHGDFVPNQNHVSFDVPNSDLSTQLLEKILTKIKEQHSEKEKMKRKADDEERMCREWVAVAMVVDRVLMYIFVIITIVAYTAILTEHPDYTEPFLHNRTAAI